MKQSSLIFLVLFSLSIILFTSCVDTQSTMLSRKFGVKNATLEQGVNAYYHGAYKRSLLASGTRATMTMNSFEKGGDGGGPSECDGQYHSNNFLLVALSTKWYNHGNRCFKYINIYYKDQSVRAQVIDECDSNRDCGDNIVDASYAVWVALQVSDSDWEETEVTWSDA
ncbi:hypothetical protein QVD17_27841 [Tagetes erecta]|uniref:RlpA-like double-psi beta-barrel domain-containing protein n=1 Tax=Tagetes erecta TaxID=13708 RepID=A0AAD8NJW1_TARER|nr:hypothetical protein QVD17_27841 [Tagetes erecta]